MFETDTSPGDKVIFLSRERAFTVRDVIDAAQFRGEIEPAWQELLRLLAAELKAEAEDLDPEDEAIDAAAEQFRYAHDLITAEETERWLAERGLGLGDFSAWIVRQYWGREIEEAEPEQVDFLSAPREQREVLRQELIFSDEFDGMALRLSSRVAAAREHETDSPEADALADEESAFLARSGLEHAGVASWLEKLGRGETWLRECLTMEAIYHRERAAVLSREACEREIAALRVPLTRFEVETIELDSLDAAREALLCARDDGMSMEAVAAEGRYPYRRPAVLLEEIPEDLQPIFLGVRAGDILDPIPRGEGFHVFRIVEKAEPDLSDPAVRERAEARILERHFAELAARHIQWRLLPA